MPMYDPAGHRGVVPDVGTRVAAGLRAYAMAVAEEARRREPGFFAKWKARIHRMRRVIDGEKLQLVGSAAETERVIDPRDWGLVNRVVARLQSVHGERGFAWETVRKDLADYDRLMGGDHAAPPPAAAADDGAGGDDAGNEGDSVEGDAVADAGVSDAESPGDDDEYVDID
jgi:hypothetical protein